jgi:alkanesulfonate monooxygenase SsuD/methylene tetrahydromethanopterin reductase-like flavin-dependent oxidoreductase (luciferase family)
MKRIGFLSFGHWSDAPGSQVRTAAESLRQSVELAVAAEQVGVAGAYFRVHHFAAQQANPFPLMAAIAARTSTIHVGTGVIDMRYENPLYMAEEAAQVDLLSDGRLQLGIGRGSPEMVLEGYRTFGHVPEPGETAAAMAQRHTATFLDAIKGRGFANQDPRRGGVGLAPIQPLSETLPERIWWGSGTRASAKSAAEQGMNLLSSHILLEDFGASFNDAQAEQIRLFRETWASAGHSFSPQVAVVRSILPLIDDQTRRYFGPRAGSESREQVGVMQGVVSRVGRNYIGGPDRIIADLADDTGVQEADTVIVTVPNQLGVAFNARILESLVRDIAPSL